MKALQIQIPKGFNTTLQEFNESETKQADIATQLVTTALQLIPYISIFTPDKVQPALDMTGFNLKILSKLAWEAGMNNSRKILPLIHSLKKQSDLIYTAIDSHTLINSAAEAITYAWVLKILFDCITNAYKSESKDTEENSLFTLINQSNTARENIFYFITVLIQEVNLFLKKGTTSASTFQQITQHIHGKQPTIKQQYPRTQIEIKALFAESRKTIESVTQLGKGFADSFSPEITTSQYMQLKKACTVHFKEDILDREKNEKYVREIASCLEKMEQQYKGLQEKIEKICSEATPYQPYLRVVDETATHHKYIEQVDLTAEIKKFAEAQQNEAAETCDIIRKTLEPIQSILIDQQQLITDFEKHIKPKQEQIATLIGELKDEGTALTHQHITKLNSLITAIETHPATSTELSRYKTYQHRLSKLSDTLRKQADQIIRAKQEKGDLFVANKGNLTLVTTEIKSLDSYYPVFYKTLETKNKSHDKFIDEYKPAIPESIIKLLQSTTDEKHSIKYTTYRDCILTDDPQPLLSQIEETVSNQVRDHQATVKSLEQRKSEYETELSNAKKNELARQQLFNELRHNFTQLQAKKTSTETVLNYLRQNQATLINLLGDTIYSQLINTVIYYQSSGIYAWTIGIITSHYQHTLTQQDCLSLIDNSQVAQQQQSEKYQVSIKANLDELKKSLEEQVTAQQQILAQHTSTNSELQKHINSAHQQIAEDFYRARLTELHTYLGLDPKSMPSTTDALENFKQHYANIKALKEVEEQAQSLKQKLQQINYEKFQQKFKAGEVADARQLTAMSKQFTENTESLSKLELELSKFNQVNKAVTADCVYYRSELLKRIALIRRQIEEIQTLNGEKQKVHRQVFDTDNPDSVKKYKLLQDAYSLLSSESRYLSLKDYDLSGIQLSGFKLTIRNAVNLNLKGANITDWNFSMVHMQNANLEDATLTNCQYLFAGSPPKFYGVKINAGTNLNWEECGPAILKDNLTHLQTTIDGKPLLSQQYLKNLCKVIGSKQPDAITGDLLLALINQVGEQKPQWNEDPASFLIRQKQRALFIINHLLPYCNDAATLSSLHKLLDKPDTFLRKERHWFRWHTYGNTTTWHYIISKIKNHLDNIRKDQASELTQTQASQLNKLYKANIDRRYFPLFNTQVKPDITKFFTASRNLKEPTHAR